MALCVAVIKEYIKNVAPDPGGTAGPEFFYAPTALQETREKLAR
jgi:hypothetical protein